MTAKMKDAFANYAPICGIIGPGVIVLGMLISAATYTGVKGQEYSPLNHFVSELGEVGVAEMAVAFNWGLIIGGLFTLPFMIYMATQIKFWMRWPLGILGALAAVFAILVGIFPMDYLAPHTFVALVFFWLGMSVAILYSLVILFSKRQPFPKWLAIPGLVYALTFALFTFFPDLISEAINFQEGMEGFLDNRPEVFVLAVVEWVMVMAILIWILLMAIYLALHQENGQDQQS